MKKPVILIRGDDGEMHPVQALVGPKGDPGARPVKGVDYFIEEEKAELVQDVLAALPKWEGGSY